MITALMPVNADLASSIALRYLKALSQRVELMLHDIHIVEADKIGPAPGSGWVRNTWENALIETANQEIRQFLEMENLDLKRIGNSETIIGDRNEKLQEILARGEYGLFVEGALPTFNPTEFFSLIHSRPYRTMPCPALVVKNLVPLDKVALLLEKDSYPELISTFLRIFSSSGIEVDLVGILLTQSGDFSVREGGPSESWINEAGTMMADQGVVLRERSIVEGPVPKVAQHLRKYGLVAASLARNPRRHEPKLDLLAQVASPVLICWSKL